MTKKLIIVGTGLLAEVALAYFEEFSPYEVIAFACHAAYKDTDEAYGRPLVTVETIDQLYSPSVVDAFVAIGYRQMNRLRQATYDDIKSRGYHCATLVHPNVHVWKTTDIGDNVLILENNTIQPFTSVGANTIIWSGNHFGHHGSIGKHCFITSHVVISGNCAIGNNVFIGVNATLRDGVRVADETLIGAGTTILKDTKPKEVYAPERTRPFPKYSDQISF